MAFESKQFSKLQNVNPPSGASLQRQIFWYEAGADTLATVTAAGYFNSARNLLQPNDRIIVVLGGGKRFVMLNAASVPATGNVTTANVAPTASGQHTTVAANDTVVSGLGVALGLVLVSLNDDPVAGCQFVTASIGDQDGAPAAGSFYLKTWKATATADTAQVAATTFGKKVAWVAYAA